jgi:amidase
MGNTVQAYERVDALIAAGADGGFGPKTRHPRLPGGTRPTAQENPLGAWYVRCHIQRDPEQNQQQQQEEEQEPGSDASRRRRYRRPPPLLLKGKTLAVKDTIAVAGVPMMNGSRALDGFTPAFEATAVSRALDAGAAVLGKAVAEDLCCSGSSFATAQGPVRNPHAPTYAAGGSSSGCGALLGAGAVDLALGTDQGVRGVTVAWWRGVSGLVTMS